jgi:hypothetical protein
MRVPHGTGRHPSHQGAHGSCGGRHPVLGRACRPCGGPDASSPPTTTPVHAYAPLRSVRGRRARGSGGLRHAEHQAGSRAQERRRFVQLAKSPRRGTRPPPRPHRPPLAPPERRRGRSGRPPRPVRRWGLGAARHRVRRRPCAPQSSVRARARRPLPSRPALRVAVRGHARQPRSGGSAPCRRLGQGGDRRHRRRRHPSRPWREGAGDLRRRPQAVRRARPRWPRHVRGLARRRVDHERRRHRGLRRRRPAPDREGEWQRRHVHRRRRGRGNRLRRRPRRASDQPQPRRRRHLGPRAQGRRVRRGP